MAKSVKLAILKIIFLLVKVMNNGFGATNRIKIVGMRNVRWGLGLSLIYTELKT